MNTKEVESLQKVYTDLSLANIWVTASPAYWLTWGADNVESPAHRHGSPRFFMHALYSNMNFRLVSGGAKHSNRPPATQPRGSRYYHRRDWL
jgi:hypothetical protein